MKYSLMFLTVFLMKQSVSFQSIKDVLADNNDKELTHENYQRYLSDLLKADHIPVNQTVDFPASIKSSNYTLTEGKISRFYEPPAFYGDFDRVLFHQLNHEFYGIAQVFGPKIEFTFKYAMQPEGSEITGDLKLVVSHKPLEVQIDLGDKENDTCIVDNSENDVFYFYDKNLTVILQSEGTSDKKAVDDLVQQMTATWLGQLYHVIMKVKIEKIATDTKQKILTDVSFRRNLDDICDVVK